MRAPRLVQLSAQQSGDTFASQVRFVAGDGSASRLAEKRPSAGWVLCHRPSQLLRESGGTPCATLVGMIVFPHARLDMSATLGGNLTFNILRCLFPPNDGEPYRNRMLPIGGTPSLARPKRMRFFLIISSLLLCLTLSVNIYAQEAASPELESDSVQEIAVEDIVSDPAIAERLDSILEARPRFEDVDVKVDSGIITFTGKADSVEDSDWISQLGERTEGVVLVENQLEVSSQVDFSGNIDVVKTSLGRLWSDFLRRLPLIVAGCAILVFTALVAKFFGWALMKVFARRTRMRTSLKDLVYQLGTIATWVVGLLIAAVVVFPGMTPARALTFLGVGSVAIGFAFKDIFENFFAGVLILWRYPFDRGDFISCDEVTGCVEEITIRNTMIRRLDGELTIVPNAQLFKSAVDVLTNQRQRRQQLICGVAYSEDVGKARDVIADAVRSCVTVEGDRMVEIYATEFADSSVNFEITWWTGSRPSDIRRSRDEVVEAVKVALDTAGIEIPFPYRTLTFKEPLPLSGSEGIKGVV